MVFEKPRFDSHGLTQFGWQAKFPEHLVLGEKVKIGAFTKLDCTCGIEIGDNTDIAPNCVIVSYSSDKARAGKVRIGKNVYIGAFVLIMPGVTIGDNATIGAYTMVKNDVPSGQTVFGIPAKQVIKKYKESDIIDF